MTKYCVAIGSFYQQGHPIKLIEVEALNKKQALGLLLKQKIRDQYGDENVNRFIDELYDADLELIYIKEINE